MTTYPNLNIEPELSRIKTREDEIKSLKYQTEKHDHENILESLKIDNEYYRKNYKSINRKKILVIITEILLGLGSAITTSTMSKINPSIGIVLTSAAAFLTCIAIIITNEYISELKIKYRKLRDCTIVITLLHQKTLKKSMIE